ncbi:ABC transporter substrate-binding protein [Miniimonas sp. S16]|uniref:ABC transporter substrate-binding protein n=1 Tax=Miniimonas sp. S16 TaxID=2171623 RepID=UPI000D5261FE|nr:extracellular solute-binding protein [Miniimonas sp. S16]
MRSSRTRSVATATALAASLALVLTACGGGSGSGSDATGDSTQAAGGDASTDAGAGSGEQIKLTVATFNDFGYTDELFDQYEADHPGVTVEQVKAAKSEDARTNMTTKLGAGGTGLADIEAIEVDWLPELMQYPDLFVDLSDPALADRWVQWKVDQATTTDGKLIGYGTDIGPEAICYRQDLFEAAGLPSTPDEVATLLGGDDATWDTYFEVGKQFVTASDSAWYDSASATYQGMVNQLTNAYEESDGTPKDLATNQPIIDLWTQVTQASADGLSAGLEQWSADWDAAFQKDGFATMLCPAWMTGPIEERAGGVTGWNVADVFPGGGGNWGGSFLTVPASGANTEAAKELAAWLTSPEVQTQAFTSAGTFPSQIEAQSSTAVQEFTNPFFNDAPVGAIFSARAQAIKGAPFKGPNYFSIHTAVQDGLKRVDVEKTDDADSSWAKSVQAFKDLGLS